MSRPNEPNKAIHDATYYAKHREKVRARVRAKSFERNYGVTIDERDQILAAQGGICALCSATKPLERRNVRPDHIRRLPDSDDPRAAFAWLWHVDHDHVTGEVRGIVCRRCNHVLGMLGDQIETVRKWATEANTYMCNGAVKVKQTLKTIRGDAE